jgi:diguanylate cyclase (GGDEF)-like protein/PAS domain S-box-containing protein
MTLRSRLLLSLGLTTAALFVGIYQLSHTLTLDSFAKLEHKEATEDVGRVTEAVDQMEEELNVKAADWADWDETYKFMGGNYKAYLSNLSDTTLLNINLNLMLLVDRNGKEVASQTVIKEAGLVAPQPAGVLDQIRPLLLKGEVGKDGSYGLIAHKGQPLLVSMRPVRTSAGKGEPRGWLVFGSYLGVGRLEKIRHVTRIGVEASPWGAKRDVVDEQAFQAALATGVPVISPRGENSLVGYAVVADLFGKPALGMRITEPRAIYTQGVGTVSWLQQLFVVVGLIFCLVVVFVLEKFAFARLSSLTGQVEQIGEAMGASKVVLSGSDELARLAARINKMLATVLQAQAEVAAKNEVLESAVEGIAQLDCEGRFVSANIAFAGMFGASIEELIGQHWSTTVQAEDEPVMQEAMRSVELGGRTEMLILGRRNDGSVFYQEATLIGMTRKDGSWGGCHYFMKDVSARRLLEKEIEHQAFHDKLTDLPNRALFMDRIALSLSKTGRHNLGTAVLFIDLDNFKLVNDSLGHHAGDTLLGEIARRLVKCTRPGDTVARLGGDEFTVLLEDLTSPDEAKQVAERILESLSMPVTLDETEVFASASIGIAFATDSDQTSEGLMKIADTTMYHAKANGKSSYAVYEASMNDAATERMELETGLRRAIDHGELYVQYQPLIDLKTGEISGSEALVRWNHATRGLIPPSQFIPIAEETGLILPLGYFVLEEACRKTKEWQSEHGRQDLEISVNLSGRQLQQADVVARVAEVLDRTGLAPHCLKLEITESVLVEQGESIDKMNQLKALGVKLALDDFGTGYSSLSRLSAFPIDTVKIDRAFVSRLENEEHARAVVQAIMALSRSMNMNVTGEGIETDRQRQIVYNLGCETGQGYLFDRPLDGSEFSSRLRIAEKLAA